MRDIVVLVVAKHAMITALLGSLVELAGHRPQFPGAGEPSLAAIVRLCPTLILLDCDDDAACEEETYRQATVVGSRILLFSSSQGPRETEQMAGRHGVPALVLPVGYNAFVKTVTEALEA